MSRGKRYPTGAHCWKTVIEDNQASHTSQSLKGCRALDPDLSLLCQLPWGSFKLLSQHSQACQSPALSFRDIMVCVARAVSGSSRTWTRHLWYSVNSFSGGLVVKNSPANSGEAGTIRASGWSLGEGNRNPLQYSCLGNSWTKEPGGLQFMELQRGRHNLATKQHCVNVHSPRELGE